MKLTIAIPYSNHLGDTKACWGTIVGNVQNKQDVEILGINDMDEEGTDTFLERFVFNQFADHRIVHHSQRKGVLYSMNEAWQEARGDIIAILHNDVAVLEYGFDQRILQCFEEDPQLGLAGFLGAEGIGCTGGRMNTLSNMLEAEIHGTRDAGVREVITFDGLALIGRRQMFEQVGGFDQGYKYHHFYDRDISLASHSHGWKNKMIGVLHHHISGITANRPAYQTWIDAQMGTQNYTGDNASYHASEQHFIDKWQQYIGIQRFFYQR